MNLKNTKNWNGLIFNFLALKFSTKSFNEFLKDGGGGLILPFSGKYYNDNEWLKYQNLEVDETIEKVKPTDLPYDFCDEACRLVDEFRRKTVNESDEWMLYFDYKTGDVIYCWRGKDGRCCGDYERIHFKGRNIASVHSHPRGYYSFPSPENFDILENEFEDYEIISSSNAIWIVGFKGGVGKEIRQDFQDNFSIDFNRIEKEINIKYDDFFTVRIMIEKIFSDYLVYDLDKNIQNIHLDLIKKEYD